MKKVKGAKLFEDSEVKPTNFADDGVYTEYVIEGIIPGLNSDKGLMRSHWSKVKKEKDKYKWLIKSQMVDSNALKHSGEVMVVYTGYKSRFMDWDNFCSSFKHIGDALVSLGIIVDDSPEYIVEFIPKQTKCKRDDQKVVIRVIPL